MKRLIIIPLLFVLLMQHTFGQKFYKMERLGFSTRTYWELAAVEYKNGLVYLSNIPTNSFIDYGDQDNQEFSNIYFVAKNEDNGWESPEIFSDKLISNYHDGPVTFAQNFRLLCFARAYVAELGENGKRSNPNSGLYFATQNDDTWSDIEPFEHNDPEVLFYTPHLVEDGNTLYFSANLDDSRGGLDIYVSRKENGQWSVPENLGDKINSAEDDVYPFLHASGRLYFSSKGHDSFGGSDVFYSNNIDGVWTDPVKMESPVNSGSDDYALTISEDYSEGYFTSKRLGGTPGIYAFKSSFPKFEFPRPIKKNRFCFRLRENSLDTIDYNTFFYEWVINDTLKIPGHDIKYCFPGPGNYALSFNVTNKVTDTVMYDVANLNLNLELIQQPVISCPDTVFVNQEVVFSAHDSYLPNYEIDGYYWDFGDGMKNEGLEVIHYYAYPGNYKVVLGLVEKERGRRYEPEKFSVFKDIVVLPAPESIQNL